MVDCSGSMSGGRMRRAKSALALFLRSLPESCIFNILAFGDRFETLFEAPRQYNSDTLEAANIWTTAMDAKLGGTDLLRPFEEVLSAPLNPQFPVRQVFLLTDGDVKNKDAVLQCVRTHVGDATRIFAFGIGNEVSQALLKGITQFGRGKAEFVESTTPLEAPVMRQVTRALQPVLTKFEIEWGALRAPMQPIYPPAVFNGERFDLHTFFEAPVDSFAAQTRFEIKIKASAEQHAVEFPCTIDLNASDLELSVQRFAAHAHIKAMEQSANVSGFRKNIIELATKYHLASKYTSFVAVHASDAHSTQGHMIHMDVDEAIADSKAKDSGILAQAGEALGDLRTRIGGMLRTSGNYVSNKLDQLASSGAGSEELAKRRRSSTRGLREYAPQAQSYARDAFNGSMVAHEENESRMYVDDSDGLLEGSDWSSGDEEEDDDVIQVERKEAAAALGGFAAGGRSSHHHTGIAPHNESFDAPAALASDFAEKMVSFGAAVAGKVENLFSSTVSPSTAAYAPVPPSAPVMPAPERDSNRMEAVEREISTVKRILNENIAQVLERGEKLEDMEPTEVKFFRKSESTRESGKKKKDSKEREAAPKLSLSKPTSASHSSAGYAMASPPPPPPSASAPAPKGPAPGAPAKKALAPKKSGLPLPNKATSAMDIVIHAQANGGFYYNDVLAAVLGKSMQELDAKKPANASEEAWATALAIAALDKFFSATKEEWSLVASKARKYLAKLVSGTETTVDSLLADATSAL